VSAGPIWGSSWFVSRERFTPVWPLGIVIQATKNDVAFLQFVDSGLQAPYCALLENGLERPCGRSHPTPRRTYRADTPTRNLQVERRRSTSLARLHSRQAPRSSGEADRRIAAVELEGEPAGDCRSSLSRLGKDHPEITCGADRKDTARLKCMAGEKLLREPARTVALMVSPMHCSRSAGRRGCWSGWACGCAEDGSGRSLRAAAICRSPPRFLARLGPWQGCRIHNRRPGVRRP
jgi:hypothetical protein